MANGAVPAVSVVVSSTTLSGSSTRQSNRCPLLDADDVWDGDSLEKHLALREKA